MKQKENNSAVLRSVEIERPGEKIVFFKISVDLHIQNTVYAEALQLVYPEVLLTGSGKYNRKRFTDLLRDIGSSIQAETSDGILTITVCTTSEHLKKTLNLLKIFITKPRFEKKELLRIQQIETGKLELYKENARSRAIDQLRNNLFGEGDRRYEYEPDSVIRSIKKITVHDLRDMHAHVASKKWIATIGGSGKTIKLILNTISHIAQKNKPETKVTRSAPKLIRGRNIMLLNIPSKQNIEFAIGSNLPLTLDAGEYPAFVFGMNVLAKWGGFTGRLMSIVREKEGLTYGIYGKTESVYATELGYWRIFTFFSPKDTIRGLTSALREIAAINKKGITDSEFYRFKTILKTQQILIHDSLIESVKQLHELQTQGLTLKTYQDFTSALQNVKKDEVNVALKKYLSPKNLVIAGAGPVNSIAKQIQKLK